MNKKELISLLQARGFPDKIVKAFKKINRGAFVPSNLQEYAYDDIALPLKRGSTISQPSTIAFMLDLLELEGKEKVLEIGSGSGYVLALLSNLTNGDIDGVEIIKELADESRKILKNYKNIKVFNKDGSKGLPSNAPYDRIIVSASFKEIPTQLYPQLKNNGRIVAPVKGSIYQIKKENGEITKREFPGFAFVPMSDENIL